MLAGERQQSAVQAVGPPSRGFVRISTTRRRSFTGAPAGSNQANSFLTNASHPPSGTQPPQKQPTSGPGQTQTQTDGDEEGEDTLGPLPESNGLQSSSTTPRQDSTESQGTDATTPSGKRGEIGHVHAYCALEATTYLAWSVLHDVHGVCVDVYRHARMQAKLMKTPAGWPDEHM